MAKTTKKAKAYKENYVEEEFSQGTIRLYEGERGWYGTVSFECGVAIRVTVVEKTKKHPTFVSYPSYKNKQDEFVSLAYVFDKDLIKEINQVVAEIVELD